jgi:hypothetical protein
VSGAPRPSPDRGFLGRQDIIEDVIQSLSFIRSEVARDFREPSEEQVALLEPPIAPARIGERFDRAIVVTGRAVLLVLPLELGHARGGCEVSWPIPHGEKMSAPIRSAEPRQEPQNQDARGVLLERSRQVVRDPNHESDDAGPPAGPKVADDRDGKVIPRDPRLLQNFPADLAPQIREEPRGPVLMVWIVRILLTTSSVKQNPAGSEMSPEPACFPSDPPYLLSA